jgi:hypothetical protein
LPELLIVFQGIHQTLSAEQALKLMNVSVTLVPTPFAVKASCGFSLLAGVQDHKVPSWWDRVAAPAVLYRVVMLEGRRKYEEIDRRKGAGVSTTGDPMQKSVDGVRPG